MYEDGDDQFYQGYPSQSRRGGSLLATILTSILTTVAVFFGLRELESRGYLGGKPRSPTAGAVEVPNVVGVRLEQARELLKLKNLLISISEEREDSKRAAGSIIAQSPLAGSETQPGTTVLVVLARPVSTVLVPPVAGLKAEEAGRLITAKGLVLGQQKAGTSETVAAGSVIESQPAGGSAVQPGSAVVLVVAAAAGKAVPKVTGTRLTKAKRVLEEAGFKLGKTKYEYDPCCGEYIILRQSPEAGQTAAPGATIDLIVNEPG